MTMRRRLMFALFPVLLTIACGDDDTCPDGQTRIGSACVHNADDAGRDATMGVRDAGPDALSACSVECTGETPVCNEITTECVQCLAPEDCEDMGDATMCMDGNCVECMTNADCSEPGKSVCATGGATAGTCVPCAAATSAADCDGVVNGDVPLNICDESGESPVCVECNAGDESACDTNVCDVLAKTCSNEVQGLTEACEACVSDTQCEGDLACIPVGAEEPRSFYCMKDSMAAGGCSEPFTIGISGRSSIGGTLGNTYCGINETLATCENVRGLLDNTQCPGGMDEECPEGGLCRTVGLTMNRCTYECGGPVECDNTPRPGSSCGNATNMNMGPDYCGGNPG